MRIRKQGSYSVILGPHRVKGSINPPRCLYSGQPEPQLLPAPTPILHALTHTQTLSMPPSFLFICFWCWRFWEFFCLFFGYHAAYGIPKPEIRFKLLLGPTPQLWQCRILNPVSLAGDRTCIPVLQRHGSISLSLSLSFFKLRYNWHTMGFGWTTWFNIRYLLCNDYKKVPDTHHHTQLQCFPCDENI